MTAWLKRAAMILAGLGLAAALVYGFRPRPVVVDVGLVERGPLRITIDEDGKTRIRERYVVSSPLAGRLQRVALHAGDPVEARCTLLTSIEPADPALLDARALAEAQARVKAAKAVRAQTDTRLAKARSEWEVAESEYTRAKGLFEQHAMSQNDFDDAALLARTRSQELRAAQFAVQIADFELEQSRAALIRTAPPSESGGEVWRIDVRSPIDGRVLRVLQESAAVVQAGTPIVELGDPANLEIVVDVLSSDAVKIAPGMSVWLEHWGGERPLAGRVRLVEPSGFTKVSALGVEEQRVNVIVDLTDPPVARASLGDGFRVEARIVIWEADDALQVPAGALFRRGDDWAVFVVNDGRAALRVVRIGQRNDLAAEVLDGLQENARVVVHPSDKIDDGVAVVVK